MLPKFLAVNRSQSIYHPVSLKLPKHQHLRQGSRKEVSTLTFLRLPYAVSHAGYLVWKYGVVVVVRRGRRTAEPDHKL
ncbi:hypothetical protein K443DRAFT_679573 [Laccaria amethystina LaAM-08-1]|uniref:Uncharacterized protein n=1 Tax=Laccaria amethystina LaAM-08-1 TaxID=1095629 RepID=A0A0C9WPM1_9AGAR|nr:hypothetical protein K443DRAFT_679573 [Laccaria amethystina LaAM-08-1]